MDDVQDPNTGAAVDPSVVAPVSMPAAEPAPAEETPAAPEAAA